MLKNHVLAALLLAVVITPSQSLKVQEFDDSGSSDLYDIDFRVPDDFQTLAMIELEEHEQSETPSFSVCKYLLETTAGRVSAGDEWAAIAGHMADVRETLPEHVRTACDSFVKQNRNDIISLLQIDDLEAQLQQVADEADAEEAASTVPDQEITTASPDQQQEMFKKFWENKGKYCGACLTLTKKLQKWISLKCTQDVIADRIIRMCGTLPTKLREQCEGSHLWIREYVIKQLAAKIPLPNHCAYLGLCEKTMVIRALQNPMVLSEEQNALIQDIEGVNPSPVQEGKAVLQRPHDTPTTAPEITFDLFGGGVSYRDVEKSAGDHLPKVYIDGTSEPVSLLETGAELEFDNAEDPHVTLNAQDAAHVHVPIMHHHLKSETGMDINKQAFGLQGNHLPIENKYLKGCAACQFTIGGLFEFMSNPRTVRTVLPVVKKACTSCNSPEEAAKCEEFVETHGVAFYQDVIRQGMPSKWCPRIELCEAQYFLPSPFVLSDNYNKIRDSVRQVSDF